MIFRRVVISHRMFNFHPKLIPSETFPYSAGFMWTWQRWPNVGICDFKTSWVMIIKNELKKMRTWLRYFLELLQRERKRPARIHPQAEELPSPHSCKHNPPRPRAFGIFGCYAACWCSGWTHRWSRSESTVGNVGRNQKASCVIWKWAETPGKQTKSRR